MDPKIKDAQNQTERLAAILEVAVKKGRAKTNADFMAILHPFMDLIESTALHNEASAGKIVGQALREKSLVEYGKRQTQALWEIAEIIRKLELDV